MLAGVVADCRGEADSGQAAFESKCASCHGARGEGVANVHEEPLAGELSVADLASFIEGSMPEDDPESCVGEEARQIADYMYGAFYSPEARLKHRLDGAARVELARLTVEQYRNAVADLIAHFTPQPAAASQTETPDEGAAVAAPGLQADYFQSKGMSKANELKQQRVDHRIDFDFGEQGPSGEIAADQFAIIWEGAVLAGDTGHYEFRVRTPNGARLYVNNDQTGSRKRLRDDSAVAGQAALVDMWVSSGETRERRARVFLLGGRRYPLRLEFFKYKEKTASIRLEWKPPHGAWSVLDHNHLVAAPAARSFVVETPFPPDDRSLGYERGSSVSPEWHAATTGGAIAAAAEVVNRLPLLAGFKEKDPQRAERVREFLLRFASVAFRRPLTGPEEQLFGESMFAGEASAESAARRAVMLILKSPHFLYTDLTPAGQLPSQHTIAARLAFALWDSIPDEPLRHAADHGELATREQIESQARRMMNGPRARAKMHGFFGHWLELEGRDLAKDQQMFPEFDEAVIADLRRSLELFLDQVAWSEASDYRELLLADYLVLNERLRGLYRPEASDAQPPAAQPPVEDAPDESAEVAPAASAQPPADFERVAFPPERRAGVLTHPYLLSAFAYHNSTSPIHRGVFLTRNVVGRTLQPPPMAVAFNNEEFSPELTMREKITQLTRNKACMSCHAVINPLGFALENFDAVGRWRTSDNEKPVDAKSEYQTADGESLAIANARDIAQFAAGGDSASRAFVKSVFHHVVKQSPLAYGTETVEELRLQFAEDDFNMRKLWASIAARAAVHGQRATAEPESEP